MSLHGKVSLFRILVVLVLLVSVASVNAATPGSKCIVTPAIDPVARQYLRQMADYVRGLNQFTVHVDVTMEIVTGSNMRLDADKEMDVSVERPNHLRVNSNVPDHEREIIYDGSNITIFSPKNKYYAVVPAPPTIDATIARARQMGIEMPLADLLDDDPYTALIKPARHGYFIGQSLVRGVKCNQLAFRGKDMDWQIWIEASATPLPRRVVIIDRLLPSAPRYSATLANWDTNPTFAADIFTFVPPPGSEKIPFIPQRKR